MNGKNVIVVCICIGLLAFFSCRKQDRGWSGTVTSEGDVRVVQNPAVPFYGELQLEAEMDLSIGKEDDENFQFFRALGLALDSADNIYVLDAGNGRVQKFSPDGGYLKTIGKKGEGPGELNAPIALFIDGQDTIYVADRQRLHVFDASGEYQQSFPLEHGILAFCVDAGGGFAASGIKRMEDGTRQVVSVFDSDGNLVRAIQEFSDVKVVSKSGNGAVVSFKAYHQYSNRLGLEATPGGGMIYGYPTDYRIYKSDGLGNPVMFFGREQQPEDISRAEKDFIIDGIGEAFSQRGHNLPRDVLEETCQFPPYKPFFRGFIVDDEGRIYVAQSGSVLQREAPVEIDIFAPDGIYLYRISLPFNPNLIHSGYAYDIYTSDETGEVSVRRYRIKNWDQIEKGADI